MTPSLPIFSGEVSGRTTSADIATSVSPTKLPAAKAAQRAEAAELRLQVRRQRPIGIQAQHAAGEHGLTDQPEIAAPFERRARRRALIAGVAAGLRSGGSAGRRRIAGARPRRARRPRCARGSDRCGCRGRRRRRPARTVSATPSNDARCQPPVAPIRNARVNSRSPRSDSRARSSFASNARFSCRETIALAVTRSITPSSIRFSSVDAGLLGAAPGQRKRDAAALAHPVRIRQRQARAVGEAVAVFVAEDRRTA